MLNIRIDSTDPVFNLALEEALFQTLPPEHPGWFLLWQNGPSVIIGRHQCAAEEVNEQYLRENGIPVVRRITGGGAVYHDQGNLNFSFIQNLAGFKADFAHFLKPVQAALASLGVTAELSGRNDLEAGGQKISGSGQLRKNGKILHHGTLLINADFQKMRLALTPSKEKTARHGVASVKSRVRNLAECWRPGNDVDTLKAALAAFCAPEKGVLPQDALEAARFLARLKYSRREWTYGAVFPHDFGKSCAFPWGETRWLAATRNGRIVACRIFGDFFADAPIEELECLFIGHNSASLGAALANVDWQKFFRGCEPGAMNDFFSLPEDHDE